jgi:hypothetical protein
MTLTTSHVADCEPCGFSKSKRSISCLQQTPPLKILGVVHVDVVGPITTEGLDGERYWLLITDGKSRCMWCFTLDSCAALGEQLVTWCRQMKAQGHTVVTVHTDNARELVGARNERYFNLEGIVVVTLPLYDATRNGVAERANGINED